jgi:hypothetical protein
VDLSGGNPETAPELLTMTTGAASMPGLPVAGFLTLDHTAPFFGWHRAAAIDDIDAHISALYRGLRVLAQLLQSGPNAELLSMLEMKHEEIARAVGLPLAEMNGGLLEGLSHLRETPGFLVDLTPPDNFLPLLSSDKRIVNARRRDGGDALKIIDGITDPGFSVAIAWIDGKWMVVR